MRSLRIAAVDERTEASAAASARENNGERAAPRSDAGDPSSSGARRAAVFVLSLEEAVASRLLRCLDDEELAVIAAEIAGLGLIEKDTVNDVLREFRELEELHEVVRQRGVGDAVRLAEASFSPPKARRIRQLLEASGRTRPFAALDGVSLERLARGLRAEHAQTRALVLAHIPPARAASVLKSFELREREDILERIAALRSVHVEVLARLEHALYLGLADADGAEERADPSNASAVQPLCDDVPVTCDRGAEPVAAPARAEHALVSFEAMLSGAATEDLDRVVGTVTVEDLATALRGLPRELQGRVFARLAAHEREEFCRAAENDVHTGDEDVAVARAEVARALVEPAERAVSVGPPLSGGARRTRRGT